MKLVRIRLRDWRGTAEREIEIAPSGVTVIEGPNEIGKSSIAEALDLLLEELDSTSKQDVKAVKPVDRDAGPEVEVELETGPYRLIYRKRFLKRIETVLEITAPRHENLTGREAHERVRQILAETLDESLWKTLRITQGTGISQVDFRHGQPPSLAAALDRAAGTAPTTAGELSLYERVRDEYLRCWTEGGREKQEAGALGRALDERIAELGEIEASLRRLEADIEESARLRGETERLRRASVEAQARVAGLDVAWQRIGEVRAASLKADADARETKHAAETAEAASKGRLDLAAAVAETVAERNRLRATLAETAPGVQRARARAEGAKKTLERARAERTAAESLAKVRRTDLAVLRDDELLADWRARRERAEAARGKLADADAALVANRVDEKVLAGVVAADRSVATARARLEVAGASLRIEAFAPIDVEVGGAPVHLEPGHPVRRPIETEMTVMLPGLVELEVRAGSGDASLRTALDRAEAACRAACGEAGVADLAEAEAAARGRVEAIAAKGEQERIIAEALGPKGLASLPMLDERIAGAERRIREHGETRPVEPPMAAGVDSARDEAEAAEIRLDAAGRTVETAVLEDGAARRRLEELRQQTQNAEVAAQVAAETAERRVAELTAARAAAPDEALERARASAAADLAVAASVAGAAAEALRRAAPEETEVLLGNARQVLEGAARDLRTCEMTLVAVEARLREHGEDGLTERRDRAITQRDVAARDLETYRARAAARRLLYETMTAARDHARQAYVAPLRERVVGLGRIVFGSTFDVDLTDDLRIGTRTLNGITLPFESLSVGAREQLGIILRLACAIAVAPDGGVPIILDDALGYADPIRLEAMGAVLAQAGRSCQVVVLTCHPDRYRHVGGASIVHLA